MAHPPITNPVLSALTLTTVGLICKAYLNLGFCAGVRIRGQHYLTDALERNDGRGILTGKLAELDTRSRVDGWAVSNHIST
jgi:hypothetical protein